MRPVSVGNALVAGTHTVVYEVPTGFYALWNLCYVINKSGVNKTVSVDWWDASQAAHISVLKTKTLTSGEFIKFDNAYVVLEAGDQVHIEAETGSDMNSINTFELHRVP